MFRSLFTRRRGVALAATAIGLSGMSLALAGPAGANAPVPTITAVSTPFHTTTYPASGIYTGGTTVTVTGTGFFVTGGGLGTTTFAFGANAGTSVNCTTTTTCTVVSPASAASPTTASEQLNVDITATSDDGTGPSTSATGASDKFQYTPPSASLIIGSGSQTSWFEMQTLTDLFNIQPGCDITSSLALSPELNCGASPFTPGTTLGEQGYTIGSDNPYNDYAVQAPAIGSGNGATQELDQNIPGVAHADFFRASAPKGDSTVNRVAYAIDGQSWVAFSKIGATSEPASFVTALSISQLNAIWGDTVSCTFGTTTYHEDWACFTGGLHTGHIDCYNAQTGSGTYATWSGTGNITTAAYTQGSSVPACANDEASGTAASHVNIPENQMASIATSTNNDMANAIYYFSYGKFGSVCKAGLCQGTKIGTTSATTVFGKINSRTTGKPVKASAATIQGLTWPIIRYLYNDYSNSSSATPSSQAALNMVSELGFLCKASTQTEVDNVNGGFERADIEANIVKGGFLPIDAGGAPFATGAASLPHPATLTDPAYVANDGSNGAVTGANGYCLLSHG